MTVLHFVRYWHIQLRYKQTFQPIFLRHSIAEYFICVCVCFLVCSHSKNKNVYIFIFNCTCDIIIIAINAVTIANNTIANIVNNRCNINIVNDNQTALEEERKAEASAAEQPATNIASEQTKHKQRWKKTTGHLPEILQEKKLTALKLYILTEICMWVVVVHPSMCVFRWMSVGVLETIRT